MFILPVFPHSIPREPLQVSRVLREHLISSQPGSVITKFHRFSLEQFEGKESGGRDGS